MANEKQILPRTRMALFYSEQDIEDLSKLCSYDKNLMTDKSTRKTLTLLADTFIEELLDLSPADKANVTTAAINRMLAIKFPEASDGVKLNIEHMNRRGREIAKEDFD